MRKNLLIVSVVIGIFIAQSAAAIYSPSTKTHQEKELTSEGPVFQPPNENDSLPFIELERDVIELGDTVNITFGMRNSSGQYIAGYAYNLRISGPISEILNSGLTNSSVSSFLFESYNGNDLQHYPSGNYTISLEVDALARGTLNASRQLRIYTSPDAKVVFTVVQMNRIGYQVNRSENVLLVLENVGGANAYDIEVTIQSIEPPIGLEQAIFPYHLNVLQVNKSVSVVFVVTPNRFGIGTLSLQTAYSNSEGIYSNDIIILKVEVLPQVEAHVQIDPNLVKNNISRVTIRVINKEKVPLLIRNQLESDKILFSPQSFQVETIETEIETTYVGSVYAKGWAFITHTIYFIDSDGVGEAIISRQRHTIQIKDNVIKIIDARTSNLENILIITLLSLILLALSFVILLLVRPRIRNYIMSRILPLKINRAIDYPSDQIILDGSNIAWEQPTPDGKANIENILLAIKELKRAGFKNIITIVDAALRYQVADIERFDEEARKRTFKVLPAKVSGDLFILRLSQETGAVILTNDLFKEFRPKFPWIDSRRVPFSILNGQFFLHPTAGDHTYGEKPASGPSGTKS